MLGLGGRQLSIDLVLVGVIVGESGVDIAHRHHIQPERFLGDLLWREGFSPELDDARDGYVGAGEAGAAAPVGRLPAEGANVHTRWGAGHRVIAPNVVPVVGEGSRPPERACNDGTTTILERAE